MQPQGDSIWGNINLCIEIALNIYYLCGEKGEGIVIPKEQEEKDFSPETVAAGKESDGYLYYPKGEAMEMFRALCRKLSEDFRKTESVLSEKVFMEEAVRQTAAELMEQYRTYHDGAQTARGILEHNLREVDRVLAVLNADPAGNPGHVTQTPSSPSAKADFRV